MWTTKRNQQWASAAAGEVSVAVGEAADEASAVVGGAADEVVLAVGAAFSSIQMMKMTTMAVRLLALSNCTQMMGNDETAPPILPGSPRNCIPEIVENPLTRRSYSINPYLLWAFA